jgi:hypothetical protein
MPMITSGSPKEPKNEQQNAGHNHTTTATVLAAAIVKEGLRTS